MINPYEVFPWNDSFSTGIPKIDEQHQILIQFLNALSSSLTFHVDIPSSRLIVLELTDYAAYHFQTEEDVWHQFLANDPWEAEHKKSHNDFVAEVNRLKNINNSESLEVILQNVVTFLTDWLKFHILESDKRMAKVVLAIQSGMSPEQAKQQAKPEISVAK